MIPGILFEDNHLIVVNKPFGMPSQGDETGDQNVFDWVKDYIRDTYNKPGNVYAALLHRLDRPTGGILALAKTSKAAARISKDFQARKVHKTYYAITEQVPEVASGTLEHYMRRLEGKNIMRAYDKQVHSSKIARLHYRVLREKGGRALIEVKPETGRKHQIRVQLSTIRCTIVGDVKYGKTELILTNPFAFLPGNFLFNIQ
ncbi:MAG: RNA pseudouridine synthase [Bacteroidia bacterium]